MRRPGHTLKVAHDSADLGLDRGTRAIVVWSDGLTMDLDVPRLDVRIVGVRTDHPDLVESTSTDGPAYVRDLYRSAS